MRRDVVAKRRQNPTPFVPANPDFEKRTRQSFARQGAMSHIGATLGTLMCLVGRAGVSG